MDKIKIFEEDINAHIKIIKKDDVCEVLLSGNSVTLSSLIFTAMINTPNFDYIVKDALNSYMQYKASLN